MWVMVESGSRAKAGPCLPGTWRAATRRGSCDDGVVPAESVSDAALALYGLPPDEFVEARNTLEREARVDGDRELAKQIKALRKPSVVAASLNAVVRADPDAVQELLAAVADLRDAQQQIASGRTSDFAALQGRYRQAVRALVDLADESRRFETQAALEAAAIDTSFHDRLRTGTFASAPEPTGSFGMSLPVPDDVVDETRPAKEPGAAPTSAATPVRHLQLVRAARTKAEAARDRARAADRSLDDARAAVRACDERIAALEAELASAERDRRRAQEAVATAEKAVARSADEVAEAEEALRRSAPS